MLRSDTIRSGAKFSSASTNANSFSTRRDVIESPSSNSSSRTSSASSSLSSTSRIRTGSFASTISVVRTRLVHHGPELAECLDGLEELLGIDRLDHIRIHAEIPAGREIAFLARRRKDDDRNVLRVFFGAYLAQHLDAVHTWHLDVQQDDGRVSVVAIGVCARAMKVVECFDAVFHVDDRIAEVCLTQSVHRHFGVGKVVLDEQDGADFLDHAAVLNQ